MPTPAPAQKASSMPANSTIYLIRHAEKPASGAGLSPAGQARAQAYVQYFQKQTGLSGATIQWDYLFASADSDNSDRPLLTITPLAKAIGKPIDTTYQDKDFQKLADHIRQNAGDQYANANILVCWHHGEILDLAAAMGADPKDLPASSDWPAKWPGAVFGWLLKSYYDGSGVLHHKHTVAINEALMPDDTLSPQYGQ